MLNFARDKQPAFDKQRKKKEKVLPKIKGAFPPKRYFGVRCTKRHPPFAFHYKVEVRVKVYNRKKKKH